MALPPGETFVPPLSYASVQANSALLSASAASSSRPSPLVFADNALVVPFPALSPSGSFINAPPSTDPSPSPVSAGLLLNGINSPHISSPLATSVPVLTTNPLKRPRVSSVPWSRKASLTLVNAAWTGTQQARLGRALARITASCGFPYRWVENPEWTDFLTEFLPLARPITRRQLSNTLIPREVNEFRNEAKKACAGLFATLQCDGWSGINFHHFLAFMITTQNREVHTVKVFDTSAERKTAEALLGEIRLVINLLPRRLLLEGDPSLVTPDCMAHQNALVVGDYMRVSGTALLPYAEKANTLITFLRSKTQILALMRGIQEGIRATNPSTRILSVIRPVVTRWTAFYLAYTRLLELRWVLDLLIRNNSDRLLVGPTATRRKGEEMISIFQDNTFWIGLTRYIQHLINQHLY
ncbi:hypothetical protein BJ912DRAFT_1065043 [Pholiota molesta]|nr:hypothetical protein BJ912DRAFT_1065043 [Pholiota molesta]